MGDEYTMIFGIHRNDFILICEKPIGDHPEACAKPSFLHDTDVTVSCNHFNNVNDIIVDITYAKGS